MRHLVAVLVVLAGLACVAAVTAPAASGQACVGPALCQPGDITSADLGVDPTTGEVTVVFERDGYLHARRFDASERLLGAWSAQIFQASSAVAVNGRTREVYDTSVARGAVNVTRYRADGFKLETWDTGFTGYVSDIEADPWSSELILARTFGSDVQLITLSRDGALLASWLTGYDEPAAAVALTTDRRYYLGVGAAEGAGGRVARYDDLGTRTAEWAVDERPVALALGPDNNLFVATRTEAAHRGSVIVLSDFGTVRDTWPLGARPVDIEVTPDGNVYVLLLRAYGRALQVVRLSPGGQRTAAWMAWMQLQLPAVRQTLPTALP